MINWISKFIISFCIFSSLFILTDFLKEAEPNENSKSINQYQNNLWSAEVINKLNSSKLNFENISFTNLNIKFKLKICKNEKINKVIILKSSENLLIDETLIQSLKQIQLPNIPDNLKIQLQNRCKIIPYVFHVVGNTNNYRIN